MAKGISIAVASETREYAQGIQRGVIEPTQEVLQALEQLGRNDAGEQLQQSMREAQHGTVGLQEDIRALSTQVREGGRAGGRYGTDMKAGMHEADEAVKTAKENTASNLKEVAASFDGTAQGAASGLQGLAAEVLEGFGPGGLIAGAVLAGGIGLIMSGVEQADEQTQAFQADVAALAQSWIETGKEGKLSAAEIVDGLKGLATQTDTNKASLADVEQQARTLGVPFKDLARVYAEGGDQTQYALDKTNQLIAAERERLNELTAGGTYFATDPTLAGLEAQRNKLIAVQHETKEAAKREKEWLAAGGPDLQAKADATQTYADGVQGALHDAGDSWDDYKTKEGGLSLDKYLSVTKAKVKAVEEYEGNIGRIAQKGNQAALNYVESLGVDAAPLLEEFVHAPAAKQGELIALWAKLGKSATSSFNSQLQDGIPKTIPSPRLEPPDFNSYLRAIRAGHAEAQAYLDNHQLNGGAAQYKYGKNMY